MTKTEIQTALYNARCLCGISRHEHQGLQAYFLAVSTGLSTNIGTLVKLSACQQCAPKSQQDDILAWIIKSQTGATGTPEQIINSSPCIYCIPKGQLDNFKTYMLWTVAKTVDSGVIPPIPSFLPPTWVSTPAVMGIATYISKTQPPPVPGPPTPPFDPTLCIMLVTGGGGDTFDCYTVDDMITSLPNGGTAFTGLWLLNNSALRYAFGDDFNAYPVGPTGALTKGEGFSNRWYLL